MTANDDWLLRTYSFIEVVRFRVRGKFLTVAAAQEAIHAEADPILRGKVALKGVTIEAFGLVPGHLERLARDEAELQRRILSLQRRIPYKPGFIDV